MKLITLLLFTAFMAFSADHAELPNTKLTPGTVEHKVTQANIKETICKSGYTKTVRNVSISTKREVMKRYGLPVEELHKVEIDHMISLEIGGANDIENLWPQYYVGAPGQTNYLGAREKDVIETYEKRQVCLGNKTLKQAQEEIMNWPAVYHKLKGN